MYSSGVRPDSFDDVWRRIRSVAGLNGDESRAIWDFIRANDIRSIVEIGRRYGTGIFLMACAAKNLERAMSFDIFNWVIDKPLSQWFSINGIENQVLVCDSRKYVPDPGVVWDLVLVDGGHTADAVRSDVEMWRTRTRFLALHDFADSGRDNANNPKGIRYCKPKYVEMVDAMIEIKAKYGWEPVWPRGRSEIIFKMGNQ